MINTLWLHSNVTQTHRFSCIAKRHLGSHQKAKDVANVGEEIHEELQQSSRKEETVLGCPWNLVTILSKLGYNLLRGLTTYLYRGCNVFTKFHGHPSTSQRWENLVWKFGCIWCVCVCVKISGWFEKTNINMCSGLISQVLSSNICVQSCFDLLGLLLMRACGNDTYILPPYGQNCPEKRCQRNFTKCICMALGVTPWKFNSSPLKISHPERKGSSSNHHFSGPSC